VAEDAVARRYLDLLGPLAWEHFPERPNHRPGPGQEHAPRAPYVAAYLLKLNEGLKSMGNLRQFLVEHPALVWLLGIASSIVGILASCYNGLWYSAAKGALLCLGAATLPIFEISSPPCTLPLRMPVR
jgi:hypothetical protein